MAVLPMKSISICALKKERKALMEDLQRKGILEISNTKSKSKAFYKEDTLQQTAAFTKYIQTATSALEILNKYSPEKKSLLSSLEGRKPLDVKEYDAFYAKRTSTYEDACQIVAFSKSIWDKKAEQQKMDLQIAALSPWQSLDVPLSFPGTKRTSVFIGTLPGIWDGERLSVLLAECGPTDVNIISVLGDSTCVYVMVMKDFSDKAYELLRSHGFARPAANCVLPPKDQQEEYIKQKNALEEEITTATIGIVALADKREELQFFVDFQTMRAEKYQEIEHLLQSNHTFILTGYVAEVNAKYLKDYIETKYMAAVEIMEPGAKEDVPVIFKNNGFASPLEGVTAGFSPPGKGEMDPTFVMSLFYYMLFGIMFSDAGYGLILALVCGIVLAKYKNMEEGMHKLVKMFLFCGIATAFWGFIFGSFFGDAVGVVAKSFFGSDVTLAPIWFSPNDDPMKMLVFAMILGLIHLMTGLVMKFVTNVRNKKYLDAIYDSVFWMIFVLSCVVILMSVQTFVEIIGAQDQKLSAGTGKIAAIIAGLSALGIILTSGRESKNWFKRILKGIYGVYGITGYLSDVLSYSRLLALGLATGVIGSVVNAMGVMNDNIVVKTILFVVIFIVGHLLNFLINILGAYVHTNRLQYVEFFGKFYDGGGRLFRPFSAKTKYYKIKEKE